MSTFISGNGGVATNNTLGIDYPISEWDAEIKKDKLDTTNAATVGYKTSKLGPLELSGSFKGYWDTDLNGGDPYAASQPAEGVDFILKQGLTSAGGNFTFTGNIESLKITNANVGIVEFTCTFVSTSDVTWNPPV